MIYEKRGKFCFRDAEGKLHKFPTKEEAEKAAGTEALDQMFEYAGADAHGNEETKDNEAPNYGWQIENDEVDTEE